MQSVFDIFSGGFSFLKGKWTKLTVLFLVTALFYILCILPIFTFVDFSDFANASNNGGVQTKYWYVTLYEYLIIFIVSVPVSWAISVMFLRNIRGEKDTFKVSRLFDGFKDYARITFTQVLVIICTILWSCLLIVPGIMKNYSYAMTPYVLYDNPKVGYAGAIGISSKMMYGYRMKLFGLHCLYFLFVFVLGILNFFIMPIMLLSAYAGIGVLVAVLFVYLLLMVGIAILLSSVYQSSMANFYNQLKMKYESPQDLAETSKESETAV